jgi:uncharacterized SAM-dependent methyltransferase
VRLRDNLDANLDLDALADRAIWNAAHAGVEMHLMSLRSQRMVIPAADLAFRRAEGATIWTELAQVRTPCDSAFGLNTTRLTVSIQSL